MSHTPRSARTPPPTHGTKSGRVGKKSKKDKKREHFRFQGKSVFLTWARTGEVTDDQFAEGVKKLGFDSFKLVREQHKDGEPHYHCLGIWDTKKDFTNTKHFDIKGCHPNIQKPRDLKDVEEYLSKGGVLIAGEEHVLTASQRKKLAWSKAHECKTYADRQAYIIENFPKEAIVHFTNVDKWARSAGNKNKIMDYTPRFDPLPPCLTKTICDWVEENFEKTPGERFTRLDKK
jgi:Geminivirus Rep catalytic domain